MSVAMEVMYISVCGKMAKTLSVKREANMDCHKKQAVLWLVS